jgi:pimeloyl-ACP methyl ester carboxylesterase
VLAQAVVDLVDSIAPGETFHYAGVSLGGATGLQLAVTHGNRLESLSVQCSGAKLGTPKAWLDRAATVRSQGTQVMIEGSAQRWFAPGFIEREPEVSGKLLQGLRDVDAPSYAFCCEALAAFDLRQELGTIRVPTQLVAGAMDGVAPPSLAEEIAAAIRSGGGVAEVATLEGVAHLAPTEAPASVAVLMGRLLESAQPQTYSRKSGA